MPKICVLYTHDHQSHVIIRRQIKTFQENGYEVVAVDQSERPNKKATLNYRYVHLKRGTEEFVVTSLWRVIRRIPSERLHNWFWKGVLSIRTLSNALRMASAARREKPDFYISEDLQSTWAALFASKMHQRPVIYCAQELESEQGDVTPFRRQYLRSLEQKLLPQVDYLVTPNHSRAAVYAERYQLRREPTVVMNCPPTSPAHESNKIRETLCLADSMHIVLYHGALIPYRCLDKLIESAVYFDSNIVLVLIGEQGSYFKEFLEPICTAKKLYGRVFFLPYIPPDEISSYVASTDLGMVIYENVNLNNYLCAPTKLYEFMMMKVPVAACNFPELVELFENFPVGVTFDPQDPVSIGQAVNSFFVKNTDELAEIDNNLERARQRFTWENESLKWLALLNSKWDNDFITVAQSD